VTTRISLTAVPALALAAALLTAAPTAVAAETTCNGLPVTMTVTDQQGDIEGTPGDDVVMVDHAAAFGAVSVFTEDGNDSICAVSGQVNAYGGPGDDTILSTTGVDSTDDGGPGNDVIHTGDGNQSLYGDSGDDELLAGAGRDTIHEGTGVNGDDVVDGGPDHDVVNFSELDHGVTLDLATGEDSGFGHDAVSGIEGWVGTAHDDVMTGTDGNDELDAGRGTDDLIASGGGNDQLVAYDGHVETGDGNDDLWARGPVTADLGPGDDSTFVGYLDDVPSGQTTITGGPGDDEFRVLKHLTDPETTFLGGRGRDVLAYTPWTEGLFTLRTVPGTVTARHGAVWLRFSGFEAYRGDRERDVMIGGPRAQVFRGGAGNDVLRGKGGDDLLLGNGEGPPGIGGHDTANGGPGVDECRAEVKHTCEV
jgi:Ca2+-binding RTX toxin-like protein